MSFGTVLGGTFRLLRRHPRTVLIPALLTSIATTGLAALAQWGATVELGERLQSAYYDDFTTTSSVLVMLGAVTGFLPLVFALAANALLGAPVGIAAARALVAERLTFRGVRRRMAGRIGRVVAWTAIVLVAGLVVLAIVGLPVLAIASLGGLGAMLASGLGMLLAIGLAVPLGLLATRLGFTPHVIAVDGEGLGAAIRRSWQLTRRRTWALFGQQLVVWVMIAIAAGVLLSPVTFLLSMLATLVLPNGGDVFAGETFAAVSLVVTTAVSCVTGAVGLALQSGTAALLHLDARMRLEGLDLRLARFVEERARGAHPEDPLPRIGAVA